MTALSNRKAHFMAPTASASFPVGGSPWIAEGNGTSGAQAREPQSQLKTDVYAGRSKGERAPSSHSPARGLLIAVVPSVALWWGIISAVSALMHHAH